MTQHDEPTAGLDAPEWHDAGVDSDLTDVREVELSDDASEAAEDTDPVAQRPRARVARALIHGLVPALALTAAAAAGFLKWQEFSIIQTQIPAGDAIATARDGAAAMLSYKHETVAADLAKVDDKLTGNFRETFTKLVHEVVIPGAQQKRVSATASVPAAASISASATDAEVLVFINQTLTVGDDAPYDTASSVRVSLERVGDRWLISGFNPQ